MVLTGRVLLDHLSSRIQQAYALRRPDWRRGCSTSRVWAVAAQRLWAAHAVDPMKFPLDPELFVASQRITAPFADPWSELTQAESARRYRSTVPARCPPPGRSWSGNRPASGSFGAAGPLKKSSKPRDGSPLWVASSSRRGRGETISRPISGAAAAAFHRACPLCRQASLALLPPDRYPAEAVFAARDVQPKKNRGPKKCYYH